ncbi:transposable element Tcb2 transposase [Trichonephila clavipes]|nr:transposable element Tcb2 transposase [Trichonephila clavipes]
MQRRLYNSGLYARRPVVRVPLNRRQTWDVCSAGGNEAPDIINPTLLKDTAIEVDGGTIVWAGISLGGHTDLHVFQGGTLTGVRYRYEIFDPYVRPYAGAIGNDFILRVDNVRPVIVEEYLHGLGLERREWPVQSLDLNPMEHLWDYLHIQVAALSPPPRSLGEL